MESGTSSMAASSPIPGTRGDLILCIVVALVCFASGLGNGFTYDDRPIVEHNPRIRSLDRIPEIWSTHWWLDPNTDESYQIHRLSDRLYRPLSMTSFALDHSIWGLNPLGYMLLNWLLHALATGMVWRLACVLLRDRWVALISGLLFAVHPVHAEVVANAVGRAELISTVGILGALLLLVPRGGLPDWKRGLAAAGCCLVALFAKESAISTAPVVIVLLFWRAKQAANWPKLIWWAQQAFFAALPALIYLPIRYIALDGALIRQHGPGYLMNPISLASLPGKVLGVFGVAGHYLRLLVAPVHLSCDYSYAVFTPEAIITTMSLVGMLGTVLVLIALTGWMRRDPTWQQVAALTTIFLASYALISNVFIHIGVTVAERLMYWPSVPVVMLFAVLVVALYRKLASAPDAKPGLMRLLRIGGIALLVAFGLRSALRATEWVDNRTLFVIDADTQPRSAKLADMAAGSIFSQLTENVNITQRDELLQEAIRHADRALELYPSYSEAMRTRGLLYLVEGNRGKADEYLDAAQLWNSVDGTLRGTRAVVLDPNHFKHVRTLEQQLEQEPERTDLMLELGEARLTEKDPIPALKLAQRLVALTPDDVEAQWLLARAALASLEDEIAAAALQRVVELDPERWEAHTNLSYAMIDTDPDAALEHARIAVRLAPRRLETHHNLAQLLLVLGRTSEAIRIWDNILASEDFPRDHPLYSAIREMLKKLKEMDLPDKPRDNQ
jgi:tetratricopeptide (TPR) repeat protein